MVRRLAMGFSAWGSVWGSRFSTAYRPGAEGSTKGKQGKRFPPQTGFPILSIRSQGTPTDKIPDFSMISTAVGFTLAVRALQSRPKRHADRNPRNKRRHP